MSLVIIRITLICKLSVHDRYNWSQKNRYFMIGLEDGFGIGGGGGYAIKLNKNLQSGSSSSCLTFENPVLVNHCYFSIVNIELWSFIY